MEKFLEFNVPEIMEPYVSKWIRYKWITESIYKDWILKLIWIFNPKVIQKRIEKDYQKVYNEWNKQSWESMITQVIKKLDKNWVLDKLRKKNEQ